MTINPPGAPAGAFKLPRLLIFSCIGVVNTVADFAVFSALVEAAHWPVIAANICSYSAAMCLSFFLNRNITFRQRAYRHAALPQFARFAIINLIALAISTSLVHVFSSFAPPLVAKLMSIPATMFWGFIGSGRFVFRAPKERRVQPIRERASS